jgi:hypothetical protein
MGGLLQTRWFGDNPIIALLAATFNIQQPSHCSVEFCNTHRMGLRTVLFQRQLLRQTPFEE